MPADGVLKISFLSRNLVPAALKVWSTMPAESIAVIDLAKIFNRTILLIIFIRDYQTGHGWKNIDKK